MRRFFSGTGFPAFALALLGSYALLLAAVVLFPLPSGPLAAFAEELKVWCLGMDRGTGQMQTMAVVTMLSEPLGIMVVISAVWWRPLRAAARRALLAPAAAGLGLAAAAGLALGLVAGARPAGAAETELPFPAERLRVAVPAPDFQLVDQDGAPVSLAAMRGRVVLITAVYSRCGVTCPMILAQTKRVIAELSDDDKRRLTIVAVTLDPAHDTPAVLAETARAHGVAAPLVRLTSGPPAAVEAALDALGVSRRRDPETGMIDHANLFLLVDVNGRIAYRLAPGARQERWLMSALRALFAEAG
jgi:protein SCO1/2